MREQTCTDENGELAEWESHDEAVSLSKQLTHSVAKHLERNAALRVDYVMRNFEFRVLCCLCFPLN